MKNPALIISLDFELFWGMQDNWKLEDYQENVLGGRKAIPRLLELFAKHNIHATWATVGFMFAGNYNDVKKYFPEKSLLPTYDNEKLSSYRCFNQIGKDEKKAPCFYAPSLIKLIAEYEGQEIATHTFSHYYCRESGQTKEQFEADIKAAVSIAKDKGYQIESLVFPRNQCIDDYLIDLSKIGITIIRNEEQSWIHKRVKNNVIKRILRLFDTYFPLSGQGGYIPHKEHGVWDFAGSRMYKPFLKPLAFFEPLKVRRIKKQMLHAAKNNLVFHLWWHPHNIGIKTDYHLQQLEEIFNYYDILKEKYSMKSMNMREASNYFSE